jgi:hypothetical protein
MDRMLDGPHSMSGRRGGEKNLVLLGIEPRPSNPSLYRLGYSESYILLRVEPLLCDDREMGKYTGPDPRQRLYKHVPAAKNWRATIEVLVEPGCFYVVRAEELSWRQLGRLSEVLHGRLWREDRSTLSWRISTVSSRCQGTASEHMAGW